MKVYDEGSVMTVALSTVSGQLIYVFFTEYFLEDCIQMTNFVPPPMDRKKKDKDEEGGDDDVSHLSSDVGIIVDINNVSAAQCGWNKQ